MPKRGDNQATVAHGNSGQWHDQEPWRCQHAAALALVGVLDRVGLHLVRGRVRVRVRVSLTLA